MKAQELKDKLQQTGEQLINTYFDDSSMIDRMTNATLKSLLKANMTKIDEILNMFTDKNGEIDAEYILGNYADAIGEYFQLDLRDCIKSDFIKSLLPNKVLIISKQDILNIIKQQPKIENNETTVQRFIVHGEQQQ